MQKMLTQLELKISDKVFHFVCDPDSPIENVKEAIFQFSKYVGSIEDAIKAQQAQAAQTQQPATKVEPITEAA